jgi:hypothetical protein
MAYVLLYNDLIMTWLQVQANRAYVKEIQVNQVSCASDLWSVQYLSSQDKPGRNVVLVLLDLDLG